MPANLGDVNTASIRHTAAVSSSVVPPSTKISQPIAAILLTDQQFSQRLKSDSVFASQIAQADHGLLTANTGLSRDLAALLHAMKLKNPSQLSVETMYKFNRKTGIVTTKAKPVYISGGRIQPLSYLTSIQWDYWVDQPRVGDFVNGHAWLSANCADDYLWGWLPIPGCAVAHAGYFFGRFNTAAYYYGLDVEALGTYAVRQDNPSVLNTGYGYYHFDSVDEWLSTDDYAFGVDYPGWTF